MKIAIFVSFYWISVIFAYYWGKSAGVLAARKENKIDENDRVKKILEKILEKEDKYRNN